MNTTQILNKLAGLTKQVNDIVNLGKRFDEFPAKEILDPASKILVSTDGISETLLIQQIIDSVNNESQNNKVRSVLLGTISLDRTFAYILDTTGLTVAPDENVILSVLDPIDSDSDIQQYRERVFLWKLGKGSFGPIGSEDLDTKLFELPSIYPTEESAEDLVNSPEAIVRDYGIITDDILEAINTANPAVDYDLDTEDIAFTYYVRATLDDVKYLYQFRGENGIYGFGASQMASEDLVLIYSSSNTGTVDGSAYVTKASIGDVIIDTYESDLVLPNRNRFGYVLLNTGNSNILGIDNTFRNEAFPVGTPVAIANRTGVDKTLKDMVSNPDIRPFELPFGDMLVENNSLTVFKNTGSTLLFQSYSKLQPGASQTYVDSKDTITLNAAEAYADSQDIITLNAAKSYSDSQDTATLNAAKTYADGLRIGLTSLRGFYNPSTNSNLYPTTGGSGASGAIKKGDVWVISGLGVGVSALIGTKTVTDGDEIMSVVDTPGNTNSNWNITEHNFTYTPENSANKQNNLLTDGTGTKFVTVDAITGGGFMRLLIPFDNATTITHTGFVGQQLVKSWLVPANTIPDNCMLRFLLGTTKTGAGTGTHSLRWNASSGGSDSIINSNPVVNTAKHGRNISVKGTTMKVLNTSGTYPSDIGNFPQAVITIDRSVDNYLRLSYNLSDVAGVMEFDFLLIEILK